MHMCKGRGVRERESQAVGAEHVVVLDLRNGEIMS